MPKKISFLIKDLGLHQKSYSLIKNVNELSRNKQNVDTIIFYENSIKPCITPLTAFMNIHESYSFDGISIATCYSTANKLLKFMCPNKKYFYIYDLEWINSDAFLYENFAQVYCSKNLQLITRSEEHKKVVENCFNRSVAGTVDDFNYEELLKVIS